MAAIEQLAYLVFDVRDLAEWEAFATEVLGLTIGERFDGGFTLRNDEHRHRFIVVSGERDDCVTVGLSVADGAALDAFEAHLAEHGVATTRGTEDELRARRVQGLLHFREPGGNRVEIVHGLETTDEPLDTRLVPSGFVAGELGLGHVVMRAKDREQSERFFCDVIGFKLSDHIICDIGGYKVDIAFTHVNPRHHSVAFGGNLPKRIHHFLIQVGSLDDVGRAFDRAVDHGVRISQTIGRHPNDRMVSFYAMTPSGFEFEYGWGGRLVDDATWEPTTYDHISEWGHRRPPYARPRQ